MALFLQPAGAWAGDNAIPLQLEVSINGQPTGLIAAFSRLPDGRMQTTAGELREVGVKLDEDAAPDAVKILSDLDGIDYVYNEADQKIDIRTGDDHRVARTFDASGEEKELRPETGFGSVLNYSAFGAVSQNRDRKKFVVFDGASLSLDHRVYSSAGTLSNSGITGSMATGREGALRLDSNWTSSNRRWLVTGTAGDFISGGLNWTRPVRMGGVQIRRNFGLRPDLVTMPLPEFTGSAKVPSTVDVYINNVKTYSQDVAPGPFVINNVPAISGSGEARIVVTDVAGRQIETASPFYASADLLQPGLADFSAELGFARKGYGLESFDYDDRPVASASLRYGLADWLTLEAHGEGTSELLNGGLGATGVLASLATLTVAASASNFDGDQGAQLFAGLETQLFGVNVSASTQRTFGAYADLGLALADQDALVFDDAPPIALDRVSVGFNMPYDAGSLGLSALHIEKNDGDRSYVLTGSFARPLIGRSTFNLSAFTSFGDDDGSGAFATISMPLGDWGGASAGVAVDNQGWSAFADATKPLNGEPGSYGWRVQTTEGASTNRQASLAYMHDLAYGEINAAQVGDSLQGTATVEGAIVAAGGGIFASRRIDDAFAVVDAGARDVDVFFDNKFQGRTGSSGKVLVPGLRAYEKNKIEIDATALPVTADVPDTVREVMPADRGGVAVKFGVRQSEDAAIVTFKDSAGNFLAAGTEGHLEGRNETFVVGYDGQAYVNGLQTKNVAILLTGAGECRAAFDFRAQSGVQGFVDRVACR